MFSLHPSLYFFIKSFFHFFLMFTLVPDENSMEDLLCNSSFESMVSLGDVTPDTKAAADKEWEKLEKISAWNLTKVKSKKQVIDEARTWPGGWGPQGRRPTGGGGLARVPNLRVCKHLHGSRWHTQGRNDELTSCRGTV